LTTGTAPAEAAEALTARPRTRNHPSLRPGHLESPAAPTEPEASSPQVGFAYIAPAGLSQAKDPTEQKLWKKEFSSIRTRRDASRFMTGRS